MTNRSSLRWLSRATALAALWAFSFALIGSPSPALAQTGRAAAQFDVTLAADKMSSWNEGKVGYVLLQGNCFIEQGLHRIRSQECLAVIDEAAGARQVKRIEVLARGNVRVEPRDEKQGALNEFRTTLTTGGKLVLDAPDRDYQPKADHPLYAAIRRPAVANGIVQAGAVAASPGAEGLVQRAAAVAPTLRSPESVEHAVAELATNAAQPIQQLQYTQPNGAQPVPRMQSQPGLAADAGGLAVDTGPDGSGIAVAPGEAGAAPAAPRVPLGGAIVPMADGGLRRLRAFSRSSRDFDTDSFETPDGHRVSVFTGGVNLIVEDLSDGSLVDIVADRVVLWTKGNLVGQVREASGAQTDRKQPLEVYMEGNVFVRQGNPSSAQRSNQVVLSGKQVYFNINTNRGLVLDGTVESFDDEFQTPFFLRGQEIRQLTPDKFYSSQAGFTTSPYRGTPGYEFASREVVFEQIKRRVNNPFTGAEIIDSDTGEPMIRTQYFATGYSNVFRVDDFPVFYWPYLRADVQDPLGPLEEVRVGNTNNLGFYSSIVLDMWQLIGLDYLPIADQSDWLLDVGYYGRRGIGGGSRFNYFGDDLFGVEGKHYGNMLTWWIDDHGDDFLGANRQGVPPPRNGRGRFRLQHHQQLANDITVIAEMSYLTDTNFLESYYEAEYDTGKDQDTLLYIKQSRDNWAWTGLFQPRMNEFLPQNPWLPRADGYLIGESLLNDRLTYFNHTSAGYGLLRPPRQYPLDTDARVDTARLDTRNEIDIPLQLGPLHLTPFGIAQFTGYTETAETEGLGRIYGAGGARASLPFWRAYPEAESRYLNVHGLAHKVAINVDYLYARSNRDFTELPLLDQVDDDTSELVRRQNLIREFGGAVPLQYDPRFFALRSNVTTLPEILDDMHNVRLGLSQHLQTKRGPVDRMRIIDWMSLDLGATVFPEDERDNFGELIGLVDYKYEWHIGDRSSLISNMLYDPFDDTLLLNGGLYFQRPPRSTLGLFFSHYTSGPFKSNYVGASTSYRFSPKYAGSFSTGYDFETPQNVSFSSGFTRIGLDFVTTLGIVYNAGRKDFGVVFEILPRVQARTNYSRTNSQTLPFGIDASESAAPVVENRLGVMNSNYSAF